MGLISAFLSGPKPWSNMERALIFLLSYVLGGAVTLQVTWLLPQESYYVFSDGYSFNFVGALLSELLGVLPMLPEVVMISAILAYRRIRKYQQDGVRKALDEISSPTLKKQLGFSSA